MTTFRFSRALFPMGLPLLISCGSSSHANEAVCGTASRLEQPEGSARNAIQQYERVDRCVQREAYKLSRSPGAPSPIAEAAVGNCSDQIAAVQDLLIPTMARERTFEQKSAAIEQDKQEYTKRAKNWVIEGRAGRCDLLFGRTD